MSKNSNWRGFIHIFLWGLLIAAGIIAKRVYGHPNLMMVFHLPAAVFLVLGLRCFARNFREGYKKELENYSKT